jgi:prepilin-type processing-associated H-X9-DG protein
MAERQVAPTVRHAATPTQLLRGPWPFPDTTNPKTHYPDQRHNGVFNVLYCDGHVSATEPRRNDDGVVPDKWNISTDP